MQRLTSIDERTALLEENRDTKSIIVYKHNSNECPISARILPEITTFADEYDHTIVAVDIIALREVSNTITDYADIRHESPQCVVFDTH